MVKKESWGIGKTAAANTCKARERAAVPLFSPKQGGRTLFFVVFYKNTT